MSRGRKRFVGIDLGTSNSAIATYDNGSVQIWKDPEQKEVTASVIYVTNRGTKSVGNRAYASAAMQAKNGARLFKRFMGTDTKLPILGLQEDWTPEECSAEVLRTLYSYIPTEHQEEVKGVVVTVPAAFDQAQKSATLEAAELAGIGSVTLLQEPVAAVMAATQNRNKPGHIVVYDLGGGTLDVAVAEWTKRGIILHAHGGIKMCGGRDIDRALYTQVILPWIEENFSMPAEWSTKPAWNASGEKGAICCYAAELAKIRLSSQVSSKIELEESQLQVKDGNGKDLYLDIDIDRPRLDRVMQEIEELSVEAVRETLKQGGFAESDMDEIVFIGGPTQYEGLRSRICEALGIEGKMETDPMTAVATGAAIFCEGVDWTTGSRETRKKTREKTATTEGIEVELSYDRRCSAEEAGVTVIPKAGCEGASVEFLSETIGWSSGEVAIEGRTVVKVRVAQMGGHVFSMVLRKGTHTDRKEKVVKIEHVPATMDAVPLNHSIGVAVLEGKTKHRERMVWFAKQGEELPVAGKAVLVATEEVEAGSPDAINLKIFEGEEEDPNRNEQYGVLRIEGEKIENGSIEVGMELHVDYEIREGGELHLKVQVPRMKLVETEYYHHEEGRLDYRAAAGIVVEEAGNLRGEVEEANDFVDDRRLTKALVLLDEAEEMSVTADDPETVKGNHDRVKEARRLLAKVEKDHKSTLLRNKMAKVKKRWEEDAMPWAEDGTRSRVAKMLESAATSAGLRNDECEDTLADVEQEIFETLWKEDWYVIGTYERIKKGCNVRRDAPRRGRAHGQGRPTTEAGEIVSGCGALWGNWRGWYEIPKTCSS